jgi:hypothetical protein
MPRLIARSIKLGRAPSGKSPAASKLYIEVSRKFRACDAIQASFLNRISVYSPYSPRHPQTFQLNQAQ